MGHRGKQRQRHQNRNNKRDWVYRTDERIKGRRPSHCTVVPKGREPAERMIKRFLKKCKKERIIEKYRERQYYEKPSAKRRRKELQKKATIQKLKLKAKD
jgi:small subunit ribosomal protein S21